MIFAESAYPSPLWLVKPYTFNLNLDATEKKFNKHLCFARVAVERAFGILKGRFRCLTKRTDVELNNTVNTITTCCIFHNICQQRRDYYVDDYGVLQTVIRNENIARANRGVNNQFRPNGNALRDILREYIDNNA